MPQAAAGSSHRHIWPTSGAKHEVCRGPRYYILLTACILLGMRVCPSLVPCGIALALLHPHPRADVPMSPPSPATFEPPAGLRLRRH